MNNKIKIARLLRKEQTKAEKKLWGHLRNRQFKNLKFRRQHPIKDYIVDFFCDEYGIVVELDGKYHKQPNQKEKDESRDIHLKNLGFTVLRLENQMVFKELDLVLNTILNAKKKQEKYAKERKEQLAERKKNRNKHLSLTLSSRRGNLSVLSTKILTQAQKELLFNADIDLVEYDAISIKTVDFEMPKYIENAIFTSQNGVKSFLEKYDQLPSPQGEGSGVRGKGLRAFCVGKKTKTLLQENGRKVIEMAENASELAKIIAKNHKNASFYFFSGNLRREELPRLLKQNGVDFKEIIVYKTLLNPRKQPSNFDGVLFFSPSGVESFIKENSISGTAFCIGKTTAEEVKKYTENYSIADNPVVENVIVMTLKYFRTIPPSKGVGGMQHP